MSGGDDQQQLAVFTTHAGFLPVGMKRKDFWQAIFEFVLNKADLNHAFLHGHLSRGWFACAYVALLQACELVLLCWRCMYVDASQSDLDNCWQVVLLQGVLFAVFDVTSFPNNSACLRDRYSNNVI